MPASPPPAVTGEGMTEERLAEIRKRVNVLPAWELVELLTEVDRLRASGTADERLREASKPRDEGDPLPQISFDYGGRDVWHTDCPGRHHAAPMKHLKGRLPIGDGVVLYEYECTACSVRVFGGCDRAGRIVRRAATHEEER